MDRNDNNMNLGIRQVSVRLVDTPSFMSAEPVTSPADAVRFMGGWMKYLDRENVCVVNFQSDGRPINFSLCSIGSLNASVVHPREIYKSAVLSNAASVIVYHNHPSGSLKPSAEDIAITARLQEAGEIMGIPVYDHIIIGQNNDYYSFRENQILHYKPHEYSTDIGKLQFGSEKVAESTAQSTETDKRNQELKEITDKLEQGIKNLFYSERYRNYLTIMSRFHNYSVNNCLLIAMQRPDATYVASYKTWEKSFDRHVKRGEKGIRILAPAPYKINREVEKIDPATQKPIIGNDGKPVVECKQVIVPAYKPVSVFDVTQTYGKDLPEIATTLKGNVESYESFWNALKQASPVPIDFAEIDGSAKGYYHLYDKRISIRSGMSQPQTIKTAIHEIAHATLHDIDNGTEREQRLDRYTKETQAESIAYVVCQHYGIDTSEYSFGYIAGWSTGKELTELKESLVTIRSAASEIIQNIDRQMKLLRPYEKEFDTQKATESRTDNSKETYQGISVNDNVDKNRTVTRSRHR